MIAIAILTRILASLRDDRVLIEAPGWCAVYWSPDYIRRERSYAKSEVLLRRLAALNVSNTRSSDISLFSYEESDESMEGNR